MAIYLGSRYENSVVDFITSDPVRGPGPVCFYSFENLDRLSYIEYLWEDGDRVDQIAARFLSYPDKWWIIAEMNPQVNDFTQVPVGTRIRIPRG